MRVRLLSRNFSSRRGVRPRLIILHTTEGHNRAGTSDLDALFNWFNNPAAKVSSHRGIDAEGNEYQYVRDADKAWTSGNYNPQSLNIEQVGFASTSKSSWIKNYHRGLRKTAATIVDWSFKYGIPLRYSTYRGICQHKHISGPGGHTDCGPGYPQTYVIYWARLMKWRRKGRPASGRAAAAYYKARIIAAQRRYAGKVLGTY